MTHAHGMHSRNHYGQGEASITTRRQATRRRRHRRNLILTLSLVVLAAFTLTLILLPGMLHTDAPAGTTIRMSRTVGGTVRFVDQTASASRGEAREPLASSVTADGQWEDSSSDIDANDLTRRHADNPMIRTLINGRDDKSLPDGYDPDHPTGDNGNQYPYGQCTWWAYKRRHELGLPTGSRFGDAHDWPAMARSLGYWVDSTPRQYDAVVFQAGQAGADPTYGHVAVVEQVHGNGTVTISEANVNGQVGPFTRTLSADVAKTLEYIHY